MEDVIQCPTCSKRYRLSGAPPPTFQCRSCGTVMDLSAFAQPAAPVPPVTPAAPAPPPTRGQAPTRGVGPGRRRRAGRDAHRAAHGRRERGGRADRGYADEEEERPRYRGSSQGQNPALVWGSIGAVVVAIVVLIIWQSSRKDQPPEEKKVAEAPAPVLPPPPPPEPEPEPEPKRGPPRPPPGREDETRPELAQGSFDDIPIPEGRRKYRWSQAEIKVYPYPEYVTAEERAKIDEAMEALEWGGRDGAEAEDYLIALDAHPVPGEKFRGVGRLISEFKNIMDRYDNDLTNPECLGRLMVVDRILRKIDGMQQRDFGDRSGIRYQSTDDQAMKAIKRWNWWYDLEKWRLRREPWDEREDLMDPEEMGNDFEDEEELPPR